MSLIRQKARARRYFLAGTLLIWSSTAFAIVNMESLHLGKPVVGFSGEFDVTADAEYGNTEKQSVGTGIKLQWAQEGYTSFVLADYAYGENAGITNKNKSFVHVRHIRELGAKLSWEAFSQISNNEFTRLNLRALLGGGLRLKLTEDSTQSAMFLGLEGFYEKEKLNINSSKNDNHSSTLRGNLYLVAKYPFNENVSLLSSTYYQPDLGEVSDFRAIENASLVSKLSQDLSLKLGLDIQHDSNPAPGVEHTDAGLTIGISVSFQ